ncbi:MAG: Peptidase superfamily [Actinomycetota bacterium]|nr:Peptidase superfamily [Actinomycetota bacterium]
MSDFKLTFDYGAGLPKADRELIHRATETARRFYEIRVPACPDPSVVTHVVNGSNGNIAALASPTDRGSSTVIVYAGGAWPLLTQPQKLQILLHEWYHVVQYPFRTCSQYSPECPVPTVHIPGWFIEGTAEFESVRAAATLGKAPFASERAKRLAIARTETSKPLQRMRVLQTFEEYTVAFGAVDYLISKSSDQALRTFWPLIARTGNFTKAFTRAFGMTPSDFYDGFAKYRQNGYH